MSQPLVTWILPVKNSAKFLLSCLESICEQTYSNHKIIAIDNGSSDNSLEIFKRIYSI